MARKGDCVDITKDRANRQLEQRCAEEEAEFAGQANQAESLYREEEEGQAIIVRLVMGQGFIIFCMHVSGCSRWAISHTMVIG